MTSRPSAKSRSTKWDPRKPAAPITRAVFRAGLRAIPLTNLGRIPVWSERASSPPTLAWVGSTKGDGQLPTFAGNAPFVTVWVRGRLDLQHAVRAEHPSGGDSAPERRVAARSAR